MRSNAQITVDIDARLKRLELIRKEDSRLVEELQVLWDELLEKKHGV